MNQPVTAESRTSALIVVREQFAHAIAARKCQLDHAAYLGRELATAARCLHTGEPYIQDRAPGDPVSAQKPIAVDSCGLTCASCH